MYRRNQEFFRERECSWNQGTSINIHLQHKKEKPRREKISVFFAWKLLKIAFHKLGHFFPIFEKGQGGDLPPSSYAPNVIIIKHSWNAGAKDRSFYPIFNKRFDHLQTLLTIYRLKRVLSAGSLCGPLVLSPQSK